MMTNISDGLAYAAVAQRGPVFERPAAVRSLSN